MSLLYLCHNYIGCCSILFTTLLFYYFTVFIIYGLAFAEGIFTKWETRHKEFILCKAPFSQKVKDSLFWTTLYFWYRRLRVFSSATGTMTSSAGNIEMAKVILISLWFLYCAHRNSHFTNGKLYMYTHDTQEDASTSRKLSFSFILSQVSKKRCYFWLSESYLELSNLFKETHF